MSASGKLRRPSKASQKMAPPVMQALRRAASRGRSRTPGRLPSFAYRMSYRSTSSYTLDFLSPSLAPTPDRPLASTEEGARCLKFEPGPSNWMRGSEIPVPVSTSPTPPPRYRRYRLKQRPAPRWARKVTKWVTKNADHEITSKTVRYFADYLYTLADRGILTPKRWQRVAVRYMDKVHRFFPCKDPNVAEGTTFRDYFSLKPGKESVASAQGPALIFQCALGARRPKRSCTRCARNCGGRGKFDACRQMKLEDDRWLSRGACLNCWRSGKHAQCSLARKLGAPARVFGPSKTRSGQKYHR